MKSANASASASTPQNAFSLSLPAILPNPVPGASTNTRSLTSSRLYAFSTTRYGAAGVGESSAGAGGRGLRRGVPTAAAPHRTLGPPPRAGPRPAVVEEHHRASRVGTAREVRDVRHRRRRRLHPRLLALVAHHRHGLLGLLLGV